MTRRCSRRWPRFHQLAFRYGAGLTAGLLALLPWLVAGSRIEPDPFPLFLAAIMLSSWYGGLGPGLVTTLFGTVASIYFFLSPGYLLDLNDARTTLQLAVFMLIAVCICWLNVALRRSNQTVRRSELQLQHQLGFTSTITENLGEGVCALDERGNITLLNRAAERMLGWTQSELLGSDMHDTLHFQRSDGTWISREDCRIVRGIESRMATHGDEEVFTRKDGSTFPVVFSSTPIITDGELVGAVVSFHDVTEQKRAEGQRAQLTGLEQEVRANIASAAAVRSVVQASPLPIFTVNLSGNVLTWNAAAERTFGWPERDVLGQPMPVYSVDDSEQLQVLRERVLRGESLTGVELRTQRRDGSWIDVSLSTAPVYDPNRYVRGIMYVVADVTESKRSAEALRMSEARLAMQYATTKALAHAGSLADAIPALLQAIVERAGWDVGAFWSVDDQGVLRCQHTWHMPARAHAGLDLANENLCLAPGDDLPGQVWSTHEPIWTTDISESDWPRAQTALRDGLCSSLCFPVLVGREVHSVIELMSRQVRPSNPDLIRALTTISTQIALYVDRKRAEEALEHQALHDALTDLPNRVLLHDRLQQAILAADHEVGTVALLLMDLDHFKEVNDTFGHHTGDSLLQQVATRVRSSLRESDTVSRLGGDEFAVLLPWADSKGAVMAARKLLSALVEPFRIEDRNLTVGGSIGVVLYPQHGIDANTLLRRADVAMYVAKRANRGYALYSPEQDENSSARLTLMTDLRKAIENNELALHYQPKVAFQSSRVESVEALVRWEHPQRGAIPPDSFIALTEQTGLIMPLSRWVLSAAIRQIRDWRSMGTDVRVAVNISAATLHDPQLVDTIVELLELWDARPEWLEVEITETGIMVDTPRAMQILSRLHEMGIWISVDDFGTGYSSLSYLQRLPLDQIKIDKSFVMDMAVNEDDAFIARSVIELGHNLGLQVVAEGVKNQETWSLLATMGCDFAQGYFLSRPMAPEDLVDWLIEPIGRTASGS